MICCSSSFLWRIEVDVVALIQCTSPFVRVAHLNEAIAKMTSGSCDSVFSVTRSHSLRWTQLAEQKIDSSSSSSSSSQSWSHFLDFSFNSCAQLLQQFPPICPELLMRARYTIEFITQQSSSITRVSSCCRRHFSGCRLSSNLFRPNTSHCLSYT